MIKKMVFGGVAAGLTVLVVLGTDAVSYVRTSTGYVKDSMYQSVPVEFQIQRARQMLKDLTPEVQKNMHLIAKEEVEVQRLADQIAQIESRLSGEKEQLLRLKADATSGRAEFRYAGRVYGLDQVKLDLASRFDRYKTGDATVASLRQIHTARQKSLEAARQKLEGMLSSRRQLQVEVENLEARNQMVAAARTTSNCQFDESRLGRVKALVDDLHARLQVDERLVQNVGQLHDEIPIDEPGGEDVIERVTQYFEGPAKPTKLAEK